SSRTPRSLHSFPTRRSSDLLAALEDPGDPAAGDVAQLLHHVDNNAATAEKLLAGMLEQRDHWIRTLGREHDRAALEGALAEMRAAAVERARSRWPSGLAQPAAGDVAGWIALANELRTQ